MAKLSVWCVDELELDRLSQLLLSAVVLLSTRSRNEHSRDPWRDLLRTRRIHDYQMGRTDDWLVDALSVDQEELTMKESLRRRQLLELLAPIHGVAIENSVDAGTPDFNCTAGWIEIKQLDEWPKRDSVIVKPRHFKPEQRHFLQKRCQAGGRAWLLLCVGNEWCLVWGLAAALHVGVSWTRREFQVEPGDTSQVVYWKTTPFSFELIHTLLIRHWA